MIKGDIFMTEQQRILEMVEKGQITAAEAMELLDALNTTKEAEPQRIVEVLPRADKRNYKFLRIKVTSDNNLVHVNVNIPIRLITTIGEAAGKMTSFIPADARREMESKGIDISGIDFSKIIDDILSGAVEDPNIVDVESWDEEHNTMIRVKIYVD